MMKKIRSLLIKFNNDLSFPEIARFRGAVNTLLESGNVLFHNHSDDGFRYAYPLIQYKSIGHHAAIFCLEEGTESIGEFFANIKRTVHIGERELTLELDSIKAEQCLVQLWDSTFTYSLRKWLPFNSENYAQYQQMEGLKERLAFMEKILVGNILSFAKGVNVHFEQTLACSICEVKPLPLIAYKGVKFVAFDVTFRSNVSLPNYIGLGKGASHGLGTVVKINERKN